MEDDAVWANATAFGKQTVLSISGSEMVIDGRVVSRSHLIIGGSTNQLRHGTEYGLRTNPPNEPAFDLPGSTNCFSGPSGGTPQQVDRSTPAQPQGFPVNFDANNNNVFHEHFAPGSAAAVDAGAQYYQCTATPPVNTIPAPLNCDTSTGKLSGSVQGSEMATGLYYVEGEVDLSASNLSATVTIVTRGKMKVSGSNQTTFSAYTNKLLFMSELGVVNSELGEGESALKVEGSTSFFRQGHVFAPKGRVELSGSRNSFFCTVMGDRVTLSGQLLYVSNVDCEGTAASVTTTIHAETTGDSHINLGDGASVIPLGTTIHDRVVVGSNTNNQLTGTITVERFNNGTCAGTAAETDQFGPPPTDFAAATTVTLDPVLSFTPPLGTFSYRASYSGDDTGNPGLSVGACEGPVTVVDARIRITPQEEVNAVGNPHTFTVTVEQTSDGVLFTPVAGVKPVVTIAPAPGSKTDNCATGVTNASGQCTVVINNPTAGLFTANASITLYYGPPGPGTPPNPPGLLSLTRDTAGNSGPGGSDSATKQYMDFRIQIAPSGTNEVGQAHTFTVTVQETANGTTFTPVVGANPTISVLPVPGTLTNNCDAPDATDAFGRCTVVINSAVVGTFTANASLTRTYGDTTLTRDTAGASGPGGSGPAVKHYVNASIGITPTTANNEVGTLHTLTITVSVAGGTIKSTGAPVTANFVAPAFGSFVGVGGNTCTALPGGGTVASCTVVITATTPGTSVVTATSQIPIDTAAGAPSPDITVTRTTNGVNGNTGPATKRWVNARISLTPLSAFNPLNQQHVITAFVEINEGGAAGWVPFGGGTLVEFAEVSDTAASEFVGPDDCLTSTTPGPTLGKCSITINSAVAGTVTIKATTSVTVLTIPLTRETGTAVNANAFPNPQTGGNATKTWGGGALFLLIDEDSIDNGIRYVGPPPGTVAPIIGQQNIFPATKSQFTTKDVNDQKASYTMRDVLLYWTQNLGKTIALMTGQTGDEGWFAPNCIPQKFLSGNTSNTCTNPDALPPTQFTQALNNFLLGTVPQSKLDKVNDVRPLRARGLEMLEGQTVCAIVYDSDISINYLNPWVPQGNLQGATLGRVAFTVLDNGVNKMNFFSSSTLPEVQLLIQNPNDVCVAPLRLLGAPIPYDSGLPRDIDPHSLLDDVSDGKGYKAPVPDPPPVP